MSPGYHREGARRRPEPPRKAECGCPVAGPDEFGQFELMERWDCPEHGEAPEPAGEVVVFGRRRDERKDAA